tara:strand:- start:374 stop:481 length:108 start_codon:yes stop_codon:yes gene_type:complete
MHSNSKPKASYSKPELRKAELTLQSVTAEPVSGYR